MQKISTTKAPAAIGPYSQAIEANGTLYVSGQIAIVPSDGKLIEGGIDAQTKQVMTNLGEILKATGYSFNNVVKTTCLLADINDFGVFNEIYGSYFTNGVAPARSTFAVKALPKGALVEVDVIAVR